MPRVLLIADAGWVVNDVSAALPVGDWTMDVLDQPEEVAATIEESPADIVVVDLQVAAMGGMAVVRQVLQAFEGRDRPRLVMLLDRRPDVFLARRAGADAWVLKPFGAHELRAALTG